MSTIAPDGGAMLWSNTQDDVNTRLTREIDLTDATDPELTFDTWFDIEPWYDWGCVSVSTDGGDT
jgi:bacillopeptidase F (M6 metalloprotease family)